MEFPDELTVRVLDAASGRPVENVSFLLVLKAPVKNDYAVGPLITSQDGIIRISREECERAIRRAQEMFIMDYSGDLPTCANVAELKLQPPSTITNMITQFEEAPDFWGMAFDHPQDLISRMRQIQNSIFRPVSVPVIEEAIRQNPEIQVFLTKFDSGTQAGSIKEA